MLKVGKKYFFNNEDYQDHFIEVNPKDLISPKIKDLIASLPADESAEITISGNESYNKRDFIEAIEKYSKAIELNAKNLSALLFRGLSYLNTEKYNEAIVDFSNLIILKPLFIDGYFYRGHCYLLLETYNSLKLAIKDYTIYINKHPENGYPYYFRGYAYSLLQKENESKGDWEKAKSLGIDIK